ncbi:DUF1236 domain-containing protein [Tardiphaga sp.]|uniref:DUF1236 domain-containing protein n=1 Tax=Tardiphaga sp. TaxID=1926292 RepID=UPI00341A4DD0
MLHQIPKAAFSHRDKVAIFLERIFCLSVSHVLNSTGGKTMMKTMLASAVVLVALSAPILAQAQSGVAAGATTGAVTGAVVGGPVGAAVGAGVGAVAGGIADETRPRFRSYVSERRVPSYRYEREVRVGADLPESGVTYYEVPKEYGVTKYRYTVVNDRTVLVDPGTHRIVQIVE